MWSYSLIFFSNKKPQIFIKQKLFSVSTIFDVKIEIENMKKTILVTGGGGYIGSHCTLQLLLEDFDVIAVDNFENCIKGPNHFLLCWQISIKNKHIFVI